MSKGEWARANGQGQIVNGQMMNGTWPMTHGAQGKLVMAKWRMANEQMANEKKTHALMVHGELRMDNGEWGNVTWEMGNGKKKAEGRWQMGGG